MLCYVSVGYMDQVRYGKDGMIYNQFKDGEVTLSDGVTSFIHLDDAVEVSIQAMNFDTGIYNVADDEPVKGSDFAAWYSKVGVDPKSHYPTRTTI